MACYGICTLRTIYTAICAQTFQPIHGTVMGWLDRTVRTTSISIHPIPIIAALRGQFDAISANGRTGGDIGGVIP